MNLSDLINKIKNINLYRDGYFDFLDFYNSKLNSSILTFVEDKKYINSLSKSISCVICKSELAEILPEKIGIILSKDPRLDFYLIHNFLSLNSKEYTKEDFKTIIGESCEISNKAVIGDKNIKIGDNVLIEDNVIIKNNVEIRDNCIIRSGSILGSEGYQFYNRNRAFFVQHCGGVILENNVEIQYNTCVDKALFPFDDTIIGINTKLDNLIHIGHAAKIGSDCMIAANACIGGSTKIGNRCWVGINATVSNGLIIGDNSRINLGAVVTKNVANNKIVSGNFAIEHSKFLKFIKSIR